MDFFIIRSICGRFLCGWGEVIFTVNLVPARPPRFTFLMEADQPSSGRVSICSRHFLKSHPAPISEPISMSPDMPEKQSKYKIFNRTLL